MAISDAEYTTWLKNSTGIKVILVETYAKISGSETLIKLSSKKYNEYLPFLKNGMNFSESMSLDGSFSSSLGNLEIDNVNGEFTAALGYIWTNREFKAYLGDVSWDRSDFRLIIDGINAKLAIKDRSTFDLIFKNKMERLNAPITELTLGGTTANKDKTLPVLLGECCNVSPLLKDPTTREYVYCSGASQGLIEVRDDARVMEITSENPSTGSFILKYLALGTLTCSAQGYKISGTTYSNKIGDIVAALATEAGKTSTRLLTSEVDYTNITAFNASYPYPVGYYVEDRDNILSAMQAIAASVEAQVTTTRLGKLRLLTLTPGTSTKTIDEREYLPESLTISDITDVVGAVKLNYCKNWTVQSEIKSAIPVEHKDLFEKEWRTVSKTDATTITDYKLSSDVIAKDTYLLVESNAETEAQRRLDFWKIPHLVYSFTGFGSCLELELGQTITLKCDKNNLDLQSGKDGVIISLDFNYFKSQVTVGVLV